MIELSADKPLKRGIPGTHFYVELFAGHFTIKARGSRRSGAHCNWVLVLKSPEAVVPMSAPAKIRNGLEYLRWIVERQERKGKRENNRRADAKENP